MSGVLDGPEHTVTTFPYGAVRPEECPNMLARQQTRAALLPDCRSYELVSAQYAGGYDVESNLVAGESPYGDFPSAENPPRVIYGIHDGAIPGVSGDPTNRGVDPYIATRTEEGWHTEYVGIPSNDPFAVRPFSSVPTGASSDLKAFAFGGEEGCSPCFEGGYTGIPVRLPDGELVQGMLPASNVTSPGPSAKPDGYISQDLSADGSNLIFGSTSKFAAGGNDETGDVSIYDRSLTSDETHVVSNSPAGGPLACLQGAGRCDSVDGNSNGISELAISADGSRVILGQKVGEDADGNVYWHLYMNVGGEEKTMDLTPGVISQHGGAGFSEGVLFDGVTEDGSKVFFTTKDALTTATNQDIDRSADLYEAEVSPTGQMTLMRTSTGEGATGNTDACDPVSNSNGPHWNVVGTEENCGVVAIGGGGGVASETGAVYFLSPEQLEAGKGGQNQPNLYLAEPGQKPHFVVTLNPEDSVVLDSVTEAEARKTADFQTTPTGQFAVFPTINKLTSYENAGYTELYRYDVTGNEALCTSCDPTNAEATGDASLASNGLSLTPDGQVFFNSTDALSPSDLDEKEDVYEWEELGAGTPACDVRGGCAALISSGTSRFASSLLGATLDGKNVYFFTRDSLAPQDHNEQLVKLYDARVDGGFFDVPSPPPCKSSDECHGAGSASPAPPAFKSTSSSGSGNVTETGSKSCVKRTAIKRGRCVRGRKHHRKYHYTRHHPRRHGSPGR